MPPTPEQLQLVAIRSAIAPLPSVLVNIIAAYAIFDINNLLMSVLWITRSLRFTFVMHGHGYRRVNVFLDLGDNVRVDGVACFDPVATIYHRAIKNSISKADATLQIHNTITNAFVDAHAATLAKEEMGHSK
jgi:hypothetical protein